MHKITNRDILESKRDLSYQGRSFERSREIYQIGGLPPAPVLSLSQQQGIYRQQQQQQQQQQQLQRPRTAQSRISPTPASAPSRQPASLTRTTSAKEIRPISPIYRLDDVSIGLQAKLTKICSSKVSHI